MKGHNLKGYSVWQLVGVAVAFVVVTLVMSFGAQILGNVQSSQTNNGLPYNITGQGLTAFNTFASYLNTLAIVIIASVIIGVLITYLVLRLFSQSQVGSA